MTKPPLILAVDDSFTIRKMIEMTLKKEGYRVVGIENGFDALVSIFEERPDLVILDVSMPKLNGLETCRIIKRNPDFSGIPVLMLSAKDAIYDKKKGELVGANEYLTKPFMPSELVERIHHLLKFSQTIH